MNKSLFVAFISVFLFLTGCFKDNQLPNYETVEGVVLSGGQPVPGAQIHIRNHFDPGGFLVDTLNTVEIPFNGPSETRYVASIFHHGAETIRNTFFDDTLSSGPHTLIIPDSLLTNGVFGYEVKTEFANLTANLFLITKPDTLLPGVLAFTEADPSGNFELNPDYLALGRVFNSTGGGRFQVTDSLQIIVTDSTQVLKVQTVQVKPDQANFFEINLD